MINQNYWHYFILLDSVVNRSNYFEFWRLWICVYHANNSNYSHVLPLLLSLIFLSNNEGDTLELKALQLEADCIVFNFYDF